MSLLSSGAQAQETALLRGTVSSGQAVYAADINLPTRATSTYSYLGLGVSYVFVPRDSFFFPDDLKNILDFSATKSGSKAKWNSAQNGWTTDLPFSRDELALSYTLVAVDESTKPPLGLGVDGFAFKFALEAEDTRFGAGELSLSSVGFSFGAGTVSSPAKGRYGSAGVNFGIVEHRSTLTDQSGSRWTSDASKFGGYLSASYSYSLSKYIALSADAKYRYMRRDYSNAESSFGSNETIRSRSLSLLGQF